MFLPVPVYVQGVPGLEVLGADGAAVPGGSDVLGLEMVSKVGTVRREEGAGRALPPTLYLAHHVPQRA